LRLSKSDELLGGDVHYFAPIKFQGKVSTYTKGLALTKLNTSYIGSRVSVVSPVPKSPMKDDMLGDSEVSPVPKALNNDMLADSESNHDAGKE